MVTNKKLHCSCFIIAPNAAIATTTKQNIKNKSAPISAEIHSAMTVAITEMQNASKKILELLIILDFYKLTHKHQHDCSKACYENLLL